jgi:nitroreductase/NAD-dependent dihydropyrimidine dehydrogenase PreA subunit
VVKVVEVKGKSQKIVNSKFEVDLKICTKCGACTRACSLRLYYFRDDNLFVRRSTDLLCMECGHCFGVCPVNAIKLKRYPNEEIIEISENFEIPSYKVLMNLIKFRRSVRQFKQEPVPEDLWNKIIEVGRYSPTGHNDQSVHFTIVREPELLKKFSDVITQQYKELTPIFKDRTKWREFKSSVPRENLMIIEGILQGFSDMLKGMERGEEFWRWNGELIIIHAPKRTYTLNHDCSLAANNIMLAAAALGLGTCSLGFATVSINQFENVAKVVQLPKNHLVGYTLAVGFPRVKYYRIPPRQPAKITWL